jgi:acyl-CoA thioester hydrolase
MSELARAPAEGWFEDRAHVLPLRIYYEDTDFSGVVYHANYLRFMERGRSDFLRLAGLRHQGMLKAGEPLVWAVRRLSIDYARPAHVDEALEIRTRVAGLTGARMFLDQAVTRAGADLAAARVEVCVITLDGRPRRVPDAIRRRLADFVKP